MPPALFWGFLHSDARPDQISLRLGAETPLALTPYSISIDKRQREQLHLHRYACDVALSTGQRPFWNVTRGGEPPDFVVETTDGYRAIDCVQLAIEERRTANGLFQVLQRAILAEDSRKFMHLRGLLVYLLIYDEHSQSVALPHKRTDAAAIAALVQSLRDFRFDPAIHRVPAQGPLPAQVPIKLDQTGHGCVFYATPIAQALPLSPFFCQLGFEMAYDYITEHTQTSGWSALTGKIQEHDKETIDELLITVGGPDASGLTYPSEEVLFAFLLESLAQLHLQLKHLKRVIAHTWSQGSVIELFPKPHIESNGSRAGMFPAYHYLRDPMQPPQAGPQSS